LSALVRAIAVCGSRIDSADKFLNPQPIRSKDNRRIALEHDAVLAMPPHSARQYGALDVRSQPHEVGGCVDD